MGRPRATGKYDTREELVREIWSLYIGTERSIANVARVVRVSAPLVSKIIDTREGYEEWKKAEGRPDNLADRVSH